MMRTTRTKIVCTIGPASSSAENLRALIEAGMNVVRLNFSHGSHQDHTTVISHLRAVSEQLGVTVPILQDLSGPKMRIGKLAGERIQLKPHAKFVLTTREVEGDETSVWINTPDLVKALKPGDHILLADGELELSVISTAKDQINCEVAVGGELRSNQGINAQGGSFKKPVPTQKDLEDLIFGIEHKVDWVAQSFVRSAEEIRNLKSIIKKNGSDLPVVVKLEKREALDDLDGILDEADGIMIARGDLGLEIPIQQVPLVQKEVIRKANLAGKPVITATQMLESMISSPRPTRAEVADVANAIFDGTDAVMLSGETAAGKYPVKATQTMADVALATEGSINYPEQFRNKPTAAGDNVEDAIAHAACHTALGIGAQAIICCTRSGQTARLVAKYRPQAAIVVASPYENTLLQSMLFWGTHPIRIAEAQNTDKMITEAKSAVLKSGFAKPGDRVVMVAGIPIGVPGTTNMIKADVL